MSVFALVLGALGIASFVPPHAHAQAPFPGGARTAPLPLPTGPTLQAQPAATNTGAAPLPTIPGAQLAPNVPTKTPPTLPPGLITVTWSFEAALGADWTPTGTPTADRLRVCGTTSRKNRPVPQDSLTQLGGNFWDTPFPVGRGCILDTNAVPTAVTIKSPVFESSKMVSLVVGGGVGGGVSSTRVELQEEGGRVIAQASAPGVGQWTRVVWDLTRLGVAARTKLRVAIIDNHSGTGSPGMFVDDISHGNTVETGVPKTPLWGFVDLHTHFFNQMGSGGRMFAGKIHSCVGRNRVECNNASDMAAAMGDCQLAHGNDAGFPSGTGQGVTSLVPEQGHNRGGYPTFKGWPRQSSVAHQQMYVEWIKRAWRGGLRLAHMDVLNNHSMAWVYDYTGGLRINGRELIPGARLPNSTDDDENIKMQIQAAKDFVNLPDVRDWMGIAYTPEQARTIIQQGKLALVLGIEVDDMGGFNRHPQKNLWAVAARAQSGDAAAATEIRTKLATYLDWLYGLGVRHVFPVHVFDSPFGGAAISEMLPDLGNYVFTRFYLGNGQFGDAGSGRFMAVRNTAPSEQIFLRLDHEYKDIKDIADQAQPLLDLFKALGINNALLTDMKTKFMPMINQRYNETRPITFGAANQKGLTRAGEIMLEEMMKRGFIIDVSHSSDRTTNAVIAQVKAKRYPIMSGHTGFRDTSYGRYKGAVSSVGHFAGGVTDNTEAFDSADNPVAKQKRMALGIENPGHQLANERSLSLQQIREIRDLGGMVGIGTGTSSTPYLAGRARCDSGDCRVAPDCDGTTKAFLNQYLYALKEMNGRGVALGTDYNGFVGGFLGRFGGHACTSNAGDTIRNKFVNEQVRAQRTPVRYTGIDNGLVWMDRSRFEGPGTLSNLDPPPSGLVNDFLQMIQTEVFKETMREWRPGRVVVMEDEMAIWEGLWRAKKNEPLVAGPKPYGCDPGNRGYDRDMRRYGWGFWLAFNGKPRPGSDCFAGTDTNADSNAAWDAVKGSPSSQNADVFARVKRIYEKWNVLMNGPNPPLEKLVVNGAPKRDFDFNVDGLANYGLLPDMMQDMRNILGANGNDRAASEDLAPLFLGANDYVVMWEDIVAKAK